jgi:hypothetical protein
LVVEAVTTSRPATRAGDEGLVAAGAEDPLERWGPYPIPKQRMEGADAALMIGRWLDWSVPQVPEMGQTNRPSRQFFTLVRNTVQIQILIYV